ncbi:YoaK family protein [uncultured Pontibacter sp.]|uniref:YoaK family protein n=1 Tax=uncultured Pontibacter sp. TaxID=453356 RepID=UPI00260CCFB3|nr:YoaK family protein [uncultured Pontibacter sp.]
MLRHTGHRRNFKHNIRLAALLCLTAGLVNIAGLLAFAVLTTNVTGHAAFFAESLSQGDFRLVRIIGFWMFLFLLGAFSSSFIIGRVGRNQTFAYTLPILLEIGILALNALYGHRYDGQVAAQEVFAGSLLFAMGMQNAMVSMISGSVVRTTHLTGIFTDLGIDLAAATLPSSAQKAGLGHRITLRLVIILFFLAGAVAGGYLFPVLHYHIFFVPAGLLVIAMFYDISRVRIIRVLRQIRHRFAA